MMMPDELDALFGADVLAPPSGFAQRITALARMTPQGDAPSRRRLSWQFASLATGAGFGALLLAQFVLFAFVAAAAQ
jgi:hypothetical protein